MSMYEMLANSLFKAFEGMRNKKEFDHELRKIALEALNVAVVATRQYEARMLAKESEITEKPKRDFQEEARIGGLWQEAAFKMRDVEDDFAPILYDKAIYWFEGFEWEPWEVKNRGIDWDSINARISELMK